MNLSERKTLITISDVSIKYLPVTLPGQYKSRIVQSKDIYEKYKELFTDNINEDFYAVYLDRANQTRHLHYISKGGVNGTIVDPKIIIAIALMHFASGLILMHNHPSGNRYPSDEDTRITKKIKEACKYFDIELLDHIIFINGWYFSFADESTL